MHTRIKQVREAMLDEKGKKYSQTKFAEYMDVTRDMIATYESGRVEPSALFISTLCSKRNINEVWLRTGAGDMLKPLEREEEIALIVNKVFLDEDSDFKQALIKVIASLTPEQEALLKEICIEIAKNTAPSI